MQKLEVTQCLAITQRLVSANCSSSAPNENDRSPMAIAVSRRFVTIAWILFVALPHSTVMIALLLNNGAYPYLHKRLSFGDPLHCFFHMIGAHPRPNCAIIGDTLLHAAIRTLDEVQCHETVQFLVGVGCHPSICNENGPTVHISSTLFPIDIAVTRGFISVVEYLLSKCVPLPRGPGPVHCSATHRVPVSMVLFLIHKGANIDANDSNGDSVLHVTLRTRTIRQETQCLQITQAPSGWRWLSRFYT
jgi:hypothetical protein